MQLQAGLVIDDKLELLQQVSEGGFGVLYKARQLAFDRIVAVKVAHPDSDLSPDMLKRFEREAAALAAIRHANVVACYGYGVWNGLPYLVMEFLEGKSLDGVLAREERLSPEHVREIGIQVCAALSCVHQHELVHRDLKPSNIMITPDGSLKLIDFGLVKSHGERFRQQQITDVSNTVGTVHYMSPEQCNGLPLDGRSDIYSLGCTLWHCLTGRLPFDADNSLLIMHKHLYEATPRLNTLVEDSPIIAAWQVLLDASMEKNVQVRVQSAADLKTMLMRLKPKSAAASRRWMAFAATVVLVLTAGTVFAFGSPKPPPKPLARAEKLMTNRRYQEAIPELRQYVDARNASTAPVDAEFVRVAAILCRAYRLSKANHECETTARRVAVRCSDQTPKVHCEAVFSEWLGSYMDQQDWKNAKWLLQQYDKQPPGWNQDPQVLTAYRAKLAALKASQ